MTPASAGRTGGLTRTIAHSAAERREWAARGGRVAMGLEAPDGASVVVLVGGRLVALADMDETQRRALASMRGRELAAKRWDGRRKEEEDDDG